MIFQLGIDVGCFCSPATHPYAMIPPIIVASPLQLAGSESVSSYYHLTGLAANSARCDLHQIETRLPCSYFLLLSLSAL
jgi:hypothetical protein